MMLCELTSHGLGDFVDASYNDILFMLKVGFLHPPSNLHPSSVSFQILIVDLLLYAVLA